MFPPPTPFQDAAPNPSQNQPLPPRQSAPQHQPQPHHLQLQQQQQQLAMNGINGAGNMAANMGAAAPAGHQAELSYIYSLVEELSRQLTENRRATEDIVSGLGRVRSRARIQGLNNEELINDAAEDINAQEQNLDHLVSLLSESLEKAKYSRDANAQLLNHYASALATMLKQFHEYKAKHVADVASWHHSYRSQLAEARAENSRLREQIWDMQDRAGKANGLLRDFRRKYDEDQERWNKRVEARAAKQELRFWKRMAMPDIPDDDPYWTDDDDLIDAAEKDRLDEMEQKAMHEHFGGSQQEGDDELSHQQRMDQSDPALMGGVAMQRGQGPPVGLPVPPPRPSSTASSTGSSGQQQ